MFTPGLACRVCGKRINWLAMMDRTAKLNRRIWLLKWLGPALVIAINIGGTFVLVKLFGP